MATNLLRRQRSSIPQWRTTISTHQRTLFDELDKHPDIKPLFTQGIQEGAVAAWHGQKAWPGVSEARRKFKEERAWEIYVHVNRKTRLQLNLVRTSSLKFDMFVS